MFFKTFYSYGLVGVSVIIPTLNERETLPELLKELRAIGIDEIVVVDDGSDDGTVEFLLAQPDVRLVRRWQRDFSSAFLAGVQAASHEWVVLMDADLQHPPEVIKRMLPKMKDCDLIVASRYVPGGAVSNWSIFRLFLSKVAVFLFRLIPTIARTTDPMSGFFAVKKRFVPPNLHHRGFKVLVEILRANPDIKVCDVPYVFLERRAGKSKISVALVLVILLQFLECVFSKK